MEVFEHARGALGPVRMEWVDDGRETWVSRCTPGRRRPRDVTSTKDKHAFYHTFDVRDGLSRLYQLIEDIRNTGDGIVLRGNIGVTSHMGDALRKARIPSRIEPS